MHRGHFYISAEYLSFQGVTMGGMYSLQFRVRFADIQDIRRGNHCDAALLIFNDAVEIKSSFSDQESDFRKNVQVEGCEAGLSLAASLLEHWRSCSEGKEEEDDDGEHVDEEPAGDEARKAMSSFEDGEQFNCLIEAHIPRLHLKSLATSLLSETWDETSLMVGYFSNLGSTDIQAGPWVASRSAAEKNAAVGPGGLLKIRELKMTAMLPPAPMCPKSTKVTATFLVAATPLPGSGGGGDEGEEADYATVALLSSKTSHDVPFGDKFVVQERIELVAAASGGVDVKISGRLVFLQSCGLLQGRIRSGTMSQLSNAADAFLAWLRLQVPGRSLSTDSCHSGRTDAWADAEEKATRTERVWELQRRKTLWSSVWHPPFLPHDGRKRWRWVDMAYELHALRRSTTREESAACVMPPLGAPAGWKAVGAWLWERGEDRDEEGWQYAVDFYSSDGYWRRSLVGAHVRRRRWTRCFEWEVEEGCGGETGE